MAKVILIVFMILFANVRLFANDGAFYALGNQLIPISETNISVQKEILTLKKVNNNFIEVMVFYEFYNPDKAKTITVGFEAMSPEGDVDGAPKRGQHPFMHDFTVVLNNQPLKYEVAVVEDSLYNKKVKIASINLKKFSGNKSGNSVDFFYVYHFEALFKKGVNIIKHTYRYDVSGSIDYNYDFEYVLTAANRWGNKKIDDFTLIIVNGNFETFSISKSFFKHASEWIINGVGKYEDLAANPNSRLQEAALKFYIQSRC